jgi:hypothetical protein
MRRKILVDNPRGYSALPEASGAEMQLAFPPRSVRGMRH